MKKSEIAQRLNGAIVQQVRAGHADIKVHQPDLAFEEGLIEALRAQGLALVPVETVAVADEMAAVLDITLRDAHPVFGSTTKWHGGIGGQMMTAHCSLTQGAPPGDQWADINRLCRWVQEWIDLRGTDLDMVHTREAIKAELLSKQTLG